MNLTALFRLLRPIVIAFGSVLESKQLISQEAFANLTDTLFTVITGIVTIAVTMAHLVDEWKRHKNGSAPTASPTDGSGLQAAAKILLVGFLLGGVGFGCSACAEIDKALANAETNLPKWEAAAAKDAGQAWNVLSAFWTKLDSAVGSATVVLSSPVVTQLLNLFKVPASEQAAFTSVLTDASGAVTISANTLNLLSSLIPKTATASAWSPHAPLAGCLAPSFDGRASALRFPEGSPRGGAAGLHLLVAIA